MKNNDDLKERRMSITPDLGKKDLEYLNKTF
jgi:hypothetical protein